MPYTLGWIALTAFDWFLLKLGAAPMFLIRWLHDRFCDRRQLRAERDEAKARLRICYERRHAELKEIWLSTAQLERNTRALTAATAIDAPKLPRRKGAFMNPILQQLHDEVAQQTTVVAGVLTWINGEHDRIAAAVTAALAGGATAQELADVVTAELAALKANRDAMIAATVANTPAAPPAP